MRVYVFMYTQYEDALNTHARAVSDEGDARNAMNNAVFPIGRNLNRAENTPLPKRRHRRQSAICISEYACPEACPMSRPMARPLAPDAPLTRPLARPWSAPQERTGGAPLPGPKPRRHRASARDMFPGLPRNVARTWGAPSSSGRAGARGAIQRRAIGWRWGAPASTRARGRRCLTCPHRRNGRCRTPDVDSEMPSRV